MIALKRESMESIRLHAEREYPEECCGVLLGVSDGDRQEVRQVIVLDNRQEENRKRRFMISPSQYMQAERKAALENLELIGFYHSHPDHPAIPSDFDTEHALPWFSYLIVSVKSGRSDALTAWLLSNDRTRFDERVITEEQ